MSFDLIPCVHGGGVSCRKYGGSGSSVHTANYVHPIANVVENLLVKSVSEHASVTTHLPDLEDIQDESIAKAYLDLDVPFDISKSIYHFDLNTEEGVDRLLEFLPIIDSEILKEIYVEIFPEYPVDDPSKWSDRIARLEIKGYLIGHKKYGALSRNTILTEDYA